MESVIDRLDSIEGYRFGSATNLYEREVVRVLVAESQGMEQAIPAFTYFYADLKTTPCKRRIDEKIVLLGRACASWPDSQTNLKFVTLDD
jgi:hypothetical protein